RRLALLSREVAGQHVQLPVARRHLRVVEVLRAVDDAVDHEPTSECWGRRWTKWSVSMASAVRKSSSRRLLRTASSSGRVPSCSDRASNAVLASRSEVEASNTSL